MSFTQNSNQESVYTGELQGLANGVLKKIADF